LCVTAALFFLVLSVAAAEKQNTPSRAPKEFVLVLVLVLDWVSGLDYEDEDDDEDDLVAAAPLRGSSGNRSGLFRFNRSGLQDERFVCRTPRHDPLPGPPDIAPIEHWN